MDWALTFAFDKAGSSMPARMAMMAMTTSSSISVKPRRAGRRELPGREPVRPGLAETVGFKG
jgi:hypothetical protein